MSPFQVELDLAIRAAREAGRLVMAMRGSADASIKADGSIVTTADVASSQLISGLVRDAFPDDAILTEEERDNPARVTNERCWLIDPIDGTQQFADGSDEFDVYVALAVKGRVVVGVSINPPTEIIIAAAPGLGAMQIRDGLRHDLRTEACDTPVLASRPWLGVPGNVPALTRAAAVVGGSVRDLSKSVSVRSFFDGADRVDALVGLYVDGQEPESYEWDLAVLDIVVREAGGASTDLNGEPLVFNKADPRFQQGLIIGSSPELVGRLAGTLRA